MLTAEHLRSVLHYDPETGVFTWLAPSARNIKPGDIAGSIISRGYRLIAVDGERHEAHHLAWLYMTGDWPKQWIDHIDANRANNAWTNLRESVVHENNLNRTMPRNNKTGFKGVSFSRAHQKFKAAISIGRKQHYLGLHDTAQEAAHAYNKAAIRLHGEFARLNPIGEDYVR